MKYFIRYFLVQSAALFFFPVQAQVSATVKKWDIQDCFQYATAHNIQITSLRLDELIAKENLSAANGAKIPSLSATVGNSFNNAYNPTGTDNQYTYQLASSGNYTINSSIILWNYNAINNNIRQKELFTQLAKLSIEQSVNSITLFITRAYLDILLAKENLTYIADLVNTSEARVRQGQLFYNAGSIAKKDLLQLQAQMASDKYLLVQIQNSIRQNLLSLKQLLQLPSDILLDIVTPGSIELSGPMPPLRNVQEAALRDFPEIKIGKLGIDIASLDISKAKAGFKPVLSASGSLGTGYNSVMTNSTYSKTGYLRQTGNNFYQRAGVSLFIPIFSNRINKTNLEKANISFQQADLNLQNDQLILSQAIEQAFLNASNAREAYNAANEQLIAATESYRIASEQFRLGAINTFDLLQQRNQYVQAVQAFTQSKYTAVMQQKIYEFYMGQPVTL